VRNALHELRVSELFPLRPDAGIKPAPGFLVLLAIQLIGLADVQLAVFLCLFDEGGFGGGQSSHRYLSIMIDTDGRSARIIGDDGSQKPKAESRKPKAESQG